MYFYSSLSTDAPKITNVWGDLNKVINYVIDGGTNYNVLKIEPYADKAVKIYYDNTLTACPWIQLQTIVVTGSTKNYNGDWFIDQINESDKYIIAYRSDVVFLLAETEISEANVMKARIKPCGATRLLGGTSDSRTVIKFDGSIEFRIDDRSFATLLSPTVSWNGNWSKVARVCMAESFDTLDFTTKRLWPYTATRPNENFTPYGNYIGQSFMIYNDSDINHRYINDTGYGTGSNAYKIFASNKCMYIQLFYANLYENYYSRTYVIGGYDAIDKTALNGIIQSHRPGGDQPYTYTGDSYKVTTSSTYRDNFTYTPTTTFQNIVIYDDTTGVAANAFFYGGFGYGAAAPSGSGGLRLPNITDDNLYFSDIQVIATSSYQGKLYDIKWVNSSYLPTPGTTGIIDGELYTCMRSFDSSTFVKLDRP